MLTERKLKILEAIINDFLESAQPVGSRTISRKYLIGTSPATIRNEMADLEELGFLFQPHTSAGRVPSDLGYRFFVDSILNFDRLRAGMYSRLQSALVERGDNLAHRASELLSEQTGAVAVVCLPSFGKAKLENLKLVKVYHSKVLMIVVAGEGKLRYAEISSGLGQAELDSMAEILLDSFRGKSVEDMDVRAVKRVQSSELEYFIPTLREALKTVRTSEIIVGGTKGLLENESIRTTEQLREFLGYLDDKESLYRIFADIAKAAKPRLGIKIGTEFTEKELQDYAIICTEFGYMGTDRGYIGIIGPKRMDYEQNCELVSGYARALTEAYSGIYL